MDQNCLLIEYKIMPEIEHLGGNQNAVTYVSFGYFNYNQTILYYLKTFPNSDFDKLIHFL